jgi:hypothetical protein
MPVLVRYCNKCGIRISPLDFEMGKAIEHQGAYYCGKCADELIVVAEVVEEEEGQEEEEEEAQPKRELSAPRKHPARIDRSRAPQRQAVRDKAQHEEPARLDYPRPSGSHLPIYLLIVGVFVALIVIVMLANRGGPQGTGGGDAGSASGRSGDAGRSGDTGSSRAAGPSGDRTSAGTVDTEQETRLNARLDDLGKRTGEGAKDLGAAISELKNILNGERLPASVQSKATVMLDTYTARLRDLSAKKTEALTAKVEELVKAFSFQEALKEIEAFPQEHADEISLREIDRLKQQVYFEEGAHAKYSELVKDLKAPLEESTLPELESQVKELKKWLKEFEGTVHAREAAGRLAAAESAITKKKQERREQAGLELEAAQGKALELSNGKKYEEAAAVLEEFAAKHPEEKDLAKKASDLASTYRDKAAQAATTAAEKPKEPRFRLDFTGEKVISDMEYKTSAAAVKSVGEGNCLSMPAPEASLLRAEFQIEELPERLILGIEHAGEKPAPGESLKARVDVKLNEKDVVREFEVGDEFKTNHFDVLKLARKGTNVIEISPSRKSEMTYLLKRVGIAKKHSDVFEPLGGEKEDTAGAGKTPAAGGKGGVFDGKSLQGWKSLGPGTWEVKDGEIVGQHTGKGEEVGFVFPQSDAGRKWYDYKVSFEVWCSVAGGWQVALRAREGTGGLISTNILNASDNFTNNKWWKISIRISGESIYASVDGGEEFEFKKDTDKLAGTFAFGVKLGALVKFKNIKFELTKSK